MAVFKSEDELRDAPIELVQGELSLLSVPKPDYSFGLAVDQDNPTPTAQLDPSCAPVLSDAFLSHLQVTTGLQPWLARGAIDMVSHVSFMRQNQTPALFSLQRIKRLELQQKL